MSPIKVVLVDCESKMSQNGIQNYLPIGRIKLDRCQYGRVYTTQYGLSKPRYLHTVSAYPYEQSQPAVFCILTSGHQA